MNSEKASGDQVFFPVTISVKANTVRLLTEVASDMGISLDDVLSVLAEDAAIDLEREGRKDSSFYIPERCSKAQLIKELEKRHKDWYS
tara:strand:- start:2020 stop:2283 length:264 start_codon:yes stop_codon:yes gene_type:complete